MPIAGQPLPDKELIGGKAWSIARMSTLGLPVPPAFVVTTRACVAYLQTGAFPGGLVEEIAAGIAWLESQTDRRFGSGPRPLLVSVRSGAPVSMPGMMDTILNLGINDATERLLARANSHKLEADLNTAHTLAPAMTVFLDLSSGRDMLREESAERLARDPVESRERLIEEQHARIVHQRARDRHSLHETARQRAHRPLGLVDQSQPLEQIGRRPHVIERRPKQEILAHAAAWRLRSADG